MLIKEKIRTNVKDEYDVAVCGGGFTRKRYYIKYLFF